MNSVLITGAFRGLGRSLTQVFLSKNYKVIACGRSRDNEIKHENLTFLELDLTDNESISRATELIESKSINVDILINNAGVYLEKEYEETSPIDIDFELIEKSMQVNFYAPMKLMQSVCKVMKENRIGKVVNVSSAWGSYSLSEQLEDYGKSFAYRISKQSLNYTTLLLADELKDYELIDVVAFCPGWMRTDMGGEDGPKNPLESAQEIFELATSHVGSGKFYKGKEKIDW
ncbi:SDR family NAD(P)-dependent oxidoreductase [Vibrio tubiashii]|uniref:SDR family NAD(P)-dependent oxidoreductase n=1 Tax=Vibrio tubiashii TaxID=29498 RepID=UPI00234EAD1E|nr:SDR family NAD(P)-dependent oxidoreductase [Vibrio tubiashii]WCP67285.1 SDR family NAD(P)-dependent oxidoreductase [Vibrio tubiashii]